MNRASATMPSTMRALVKTGKGRENLVLRDVAVPTPGPSEVLVQVEAAGVCGTDLHILRDEYPYYPPVTLGHEFAGVIVATGLGVVGWSIDERVVGEPHARACGVCRYCRAGEFYLCQERRAIGWGQDGAFARYVRVPVQLLHRIPDSLGFDEAALAEPLACVVHALIHRGRVRPGDLVVVEGCGPIGLMAAQVARASGASRVVVTGTDSDARERLPTARIIGAHEVVNVSDEVDIVARVRALSKDEGADVVVEASGAPASIGCGVSMLRKRGLFIGLGLTSTAEIPFPWDQAVFKALDVVFSFATTSASFDTAIALLANGEVNASALITHRKPLEGWLEVFEQLEGQQGIKAVLIPS